MAPVLAVFQDVVYFTSGHLRALVGLDSAGAGTIVMEPKVSSIQSNHRAALARHLALSLLPFSCNSRKKSNLF